MGGPPRRSLALATIFLPNNLLRDETKLSASSQVAAQLGPVIPRKSGAANFVRQGTYTGTIPRFYSVQVDSIDNGQLGTSTYRWSDTGGAAWNAVLQPITPNVAFTMSHGLQGVFVPGAEQPDVNVGDRWDFSANVPYHAGFLLDNRPDYEYRSGVVVTGQNVEVRYDMTTAQTPSHLVIGHHNFLNTTVTRLQSSENSGFSSLEYNQVVPWTPTHLYHALISPTSARYWRIIMTCGANQGFLRAAEWYLGFGIGMSRSFSIGYREEDVHLSGTDLTQLVRGPAPLGLKPRRYEIRWGYRKLAQDIANLELLDAFANDRVRQLRLPFWLIQDEVRPIVELIQAESALTLEHQFLDVYHAPQVLTQVIRTAA